MHTYMCIIINYIYTNININIHIININIVCTATAVDRKCTKLYVRVSRSSRRPRISHGLMLKPSAKKATVQVSKLRSYRVYASD